MALKTPLIDVATLRAMLGAERLAIIDCRFDLMNPESGRQAYLTAHIPGARYADLNRDLSAPIGPGTGRHPLPAAEEVVRTLGRLGIGNSSRVVVYDAANGSFAARLWWMLRWLGHESVTVLDGGFQAWTAQGAPLESGDPVSGAALPAAAPFIPKLDAGKVVSTAEIERGLESGTPVLIDARAAERFAGSVEPIDSVAGHIPGALNHPFTQNLAADSRFLPPAELRARWRERLAGRPASEIAAMCGSGVTACHHLLGLEIAGLPGARLYAGSWSEWIRDPRRPVERGS